MTKKIITKTLILALIAFKSITASADTYTYTFSGQIWSSYSSKTLGIASWTAAGSGTPYFGYDATKGQQIGSGSNPATAFTLTTASFPGTISSIKVSTSGASSIVGTFSVKVGTTSFLCNNAASVSLTNVSTTYEFTGSGAGNVVLSWAQTSSKAQYIKDITITYTSCTASNLAFANPTVTKNVGDANFTLAPSSLNATTPITYSSSDASVATVNASTGEVALVGTGSTTIQASQIAGTHNSVDYCAATASYTLTVLPAATLNVTEVYNQAMTTTVGVATSQTILVAGAKLTDAAGISFSLSGTDKSYFSLSSSTLSQTSGNAAGTITVTYKPTQTGTNTATLTLSSASAPDITLTLNGQTVASGVASVTYPLAISIVNGKIQFSATAGEKVEVYNTIGQKIYNAIAKDGLNSITAPAQGVLMVKVNNRLAKIIL